jgi:glycosyltransferase involved in cell wall biosynthesis
VSRRLWFDVEDLFEYARHNPRPSGIQRVAFELYRTLHLRYGNTGLIGFVRHDPARGSLRSVTWAEVAELFAALTAGVRSRLHQPGPTPDLPSEPPSPNNLGWWLPRPLRRAIRDAIKAQIAAFRAWIGIPGVLLLGVQRRMVRLRDRLQAVRLTDNTFASLSTAGDVFVVLGSPWSHSDYATLVETQRARGLQFALLIYDLIPFRHPEWCSPVLVRQFCPWFDSVLPLCDFLFTISRATAIDIAAFAREREWMLPAATPLPMGTGLSDSTIVPHRTARLPEPGTYVLFVSTIEARKNHLLLFRVWQRLLKEVPNTKVPKLVFAGRVGWLVDDLMRQIMNAENLGGWLVIVEDPTDEELIGLYQGCLLTLFPSFYEGWGLPVSESLAFGKPCLVANGTSLLEAGGDLVKYFDPDNLHDAYSVIRTAIEDPDELARWEARVQREFRPVPWSLAVEALLVALGCPGDGANPAASAAAGLEVLQHSMRHRGSGKSDQASVLNPTIRPPVANSDDQATRPQGVEDRSGTQ